MLPAWPGLIMGFLALLQESWPMFLQGMLLTLQLSLVSLFFAMFIGLGSCLLNISKIAPLRWLAQGYINIIRGTPLLVQVFFIYFGITQFFGFTLSAFAAGVLALSLNAGAYLSEIFRGGIIAVHSGQMEAARSLGLPYSAAMLKIILPQALRIVIPSVVNQCIITIKDTSIISVISLMELTFVARQIIARTFQTFEVWIIVGVMYFVIIYALSKLSKFVEKRFSLVKSGDKESA